MECTICLPLLLPLICLGVFSQQSRDQADETLSLKVSPDPVVLDVADLVTVTCTLKAKVTPADIFYYVIYAGRDNRTAVATVQSINGPKYQAYIPTVLHPGYRRRAVARGSLLPVNTSRLELVVRPDSCCDVMDWLCDVTYQTAPDEAGQQRLVVLNATMEVGCVTKEFAPDK